MTAKKKQGKRSIAKSIVRSMWKWFFIILGVGFLFLISVRVGIWGKLPSIEELENPKTKLASEIYTADNEMIGKMFYQEDRTNSDFSDIPSHMRDALIATEDVRFESHSGIDAKALIRAIVRLGRDGGASTISQQLAKNLFHGEREDAIHKVVLQKLKEWILAVEIEKRYTKDEIVLMYFNTVPWGNSYGIKSASKRYFNKPTKELKIEEAAVLVAMLKAPTYYNPIRNPENAEGRRNVVLHQLMKYDYITEEKYDSLKALPMITDYNFVDHNQGLATYFRSYLDRWMKDWADRYEQATGIRYNIYDDGLKIYTTIDSKLQAYAEMAVDAHMADLQEDFFAETKRRNAGPWFESENFWVVDQTYIPRKIKATPRYRSLKKKYNKQDSIDYYLNKPVAMTIFTWNGDKDTLLSPIDSLKYYKQILQCGFMSMEPGTGHIKAWVGGINHKYFQYDHVNKRATRQVGSTFKPFVYARALDDEKIQPCERVSTGPVIVEYAGDQTWSPKNSGSAPDEVTFYEGLQRSINTATARVMKRLGPNSAEVVKQTAGKMGLDQNRFEPYPSIALGTMDLSVYEMVGAYGTFVNDGIWVEPSFVTRIEDKNGNILEEFRPKKEEAIRKQTAYIVSKMLERVTYYPGTAGRLRAKYKIPQDAAIGGKTGTTQNNSDGWFMGITPKLVSGVWVGAEERQVHFRSQAYGQGANMALPIFAKYMELVYKNKALGKEIGPFIKPDVEFTIELDCDNYSSDYGEDDPADPPDLFN